MMEVQNKNESFQQNLMLPPPPGTFHDREDLINHVRDFGASQGYVVTIKKSRRERRVILGCDRGGVYRSRRRVEDIKRRRKASSRCINCPFEAIGKKDDDVWVLTIKNGEHNHDALKDMSEHPYNRRFNEDEVRQIKLMTDAGIKPLEMLKALKKNNPELHSTPRHLYNLKAKIRQGNFSEKNVKSWKPNRPAPLDGTNLSEEGAFNISNVRVKVSNFIGGRFMDSQSCTTIDVLNPATQEIVSEVPLTTYEEFKAAVSAAKQVYPAWRNTAVTTRRRIMFKLHELILRDIDKFAMNITIEQGKTLDGAKRDVQRGLEVVEHACGMSSLQMGEFIPNASSGIDTYCITEPLGVCAGICPFHFPAMVFLWMFPIALVCGNTFILKPSEKYPGASMMLAALAKEAGLPDGVLNVVHGTNDIISYICDEDEIKAISFVSSNMAGNPIYARAAFSGKRIEFNLGAKNHAIVMPDASIDITLDALVSAGFGAAGHGCMALSTVVFVGDSMAWEGELVKRAKSLKVNAGTEHGADLGPVISKEVKDQICRLVESGVESGARLILDGRNIVVPRYKHGNFIGPTILCDVTTNMECYKEEIFGPVLLCLQAESLEEAIAIVNRNKYGNGASIFTKSGVVSRKFQHDIEAGLVGINVPVPIPLPFSSKASCAGGLNFSGKAGVQFYTKNKSVAQYWKDLPSPGVTRPMHLTSGSAITSQQIMPTLVLTAGSDLPSEQVPPGMAVTSHWSQPVPLTTSGTPTTNSQSEDMVSPSQRSDSNISPTPESIYMPSITQGMGSNGHNTSQRNNIALASQRDQQNDGPKNPRDGPIIMNQTYERIYNVAPIEGSVDMGESSERTDMVRAASETWHMSATSQRKDNKGRESSHISNGDLFPTNSERVTNSKDMSSTSQLGEVMPSTSERVHISSTSQRTHSQDQVIPMDEFPNLDA